MQIKLATPITHGSAVIDVLEVREPKAKDFRKMPAQANMGDMLDLLGTLSNQPPSVINELSVADMTAALEVVKGFFPDSPPTGGHP